MSKEFRHFWGSSWVLIYDFLEELLSVFFSWDESLSVGISWVDTQHQKLINLINHLASVMESGQERQALGAVLLELKKYTESHFFAEERMMEAHSYPELGFQKIEHAAFIEKLREFSSDISRGKDFVGVRVLDFLKVWLKEHILVEDMKYGKYFQEKGVSPKEPISG